MRSAALLLGVALGFVACAKSESQEEGGPGAGAGQGGEVRGDAGATGGAGRASAGSGGRPQPVTCSDTATVRMPFPRLMSGAVWDLLAVELRGSHFQIGIVNGNAKAGWSYEDAPPNGQRRNRFRLELFEVSAHSLELQIDWEPEDRELRDGDRWLVTLTPAGTQDVHVLMNEAVSYERARTDSGCDHADVRAAAPEPLDGDADPAGGTGGQAGDRGDGGSGGVGFAEGGSAGARP